MKIGSRIKPRNGKARNVTIHGRLYSFTPEEDAQGVTHFVAEVNDPKHASVLVKNDAFYAFDKTAEKPAKLSRGGKKADTKKDVPPTAWPPEVVDEASSLLANEPDAIATEVGKVSGPKVVDAALELEAAAQNRPAVIETLTKTQQGLKEAGLSG